MKRLLNICSFFLLVAVFIFISCQKELECYDCETNKPPIANAGIDQQIVLPKDSVVLDGSTSADTDGKITNWLWKKVAGPTASITNPTSVSTAAKSLVAGVYLFELKVTDDKGAATTDTLQVTVQTRLDSALVNRAPVACAGADQGITLPTSSVTLDASCSTDPDMDIKAYTWIKLTGPAGPNIANANTATTLVSGLVQGVYEFQVKVTDAGGLFSTDTMKVLVSATNVVMNCGDSNRLVVNARLVPFGKLSAPASGLAVAAAGNKVVFAGASLSGNPAGYGSSRVDIFDVVTQSWTTATLSARRAAVSTVTAGNKIFFAGGRLGDGGNDQHFTTVDIYDVVTNNWSVAHLSQARAYIASATVGNKVLFAGGEREWPYPVSDRVDVYDLNTGSWSITNLSVPRNGITAVTANNSVYFAGGSNQLGGSSNVESIIDIYDNAANTWSTTTLTEPKTFFAGINVRNKIYWAGGYTSSDAPSCKVEIKDPASQNSTVGFLSQPFTYVVAEGQNAVTKNDKIIWFASLDPLSGNATDKVNIYDVNSTTWSIGVLPFRISGASVISVNNTIYVAGGSVNGKLSDQVWLLEF
ncbi:hypothetical protein EXU57_16910 [Segetibacter sp. 3557_3]|uniref:Kelch repeat-containing protein n=1 Tax=Segetibacter sp. 3557_3 TaxID=2547429 RepID=UPI0010586736|nr:kelch repeat-containing protein [Segetibacter sp. 3557_3]TDH23484.1 hypothetical protein EXU57_16910 [Segetibacter sp. 3557_3]